MKQPKRVSLASRPRRGSGQGRRPAADLTLRRAPLQARGQATFDGILDATARLLDDIGGEKLTTNLIARVAGINVATLYQYFPNKQAVLLELCKRQGEARLRLAEAHIAGSSATSDWRKAFGAAIDAVAAARVRTPGTVPLRQVMRASPQLLEHEQRYARRFAAVLAAELQDAGTRRDRALLVATCAVETLTALLDLWSLETRGRDARLIAEAKALLLEYLAPHFDRRRTTRVRSRPRR